MYHFIVILRYFCLVLISTTLTVFRRTPTETSLRVIRFQVTGLWFVVKTIVSIIYEKLCIIINLLAGDMNNHVKHNFKIFLSFLATLDCPLQLSVYQRICNCTQTHTLDLFFTPIAVGDDSWTMR